MILKFLWWFLNLYDVKNHFWNYKNVWHAMPAGDVGAVRPVGAILPTATAAGPSHSRSHGRLRRSDVPCRPVMFGRRIFQCLAMPIWHWPEPNKLQMILRRIPMSLDKWDCISGTSQHGTSELFTSSGQRHLIFDPLDNRNPALRINYQRVSWLKESQEVSMKWGLGRSVSLYASM